MHHTNLLLFILTTLATSETIQKRQLFREQLLPHMGGKVPESAFWTDRLALNQLNARGIYSSTGIYLEHSHDKPNPENGHPGTQFMQVRVPDESRYVGSAGRHFYESIPSLDTTYVIRDPVRMVIKPHTFRQSLYIPYTSLKLSRYYNQRKAQKNREAPWNDLDDFSSQAKREYEPYLKKLHEVDK
ncbi:PREDICTED: uncharacterized protein LOC108566745 [Nicrophorus vespilloides]|uniref:Uncharacterized protein LOC108566745 n=1 Tax=Nicrophorus vespilloides TaxID=110193 RepID=A0ABM1N612_NICVS|nr:PREDICTED: uncharacterized protein LOC108566745 [Nicrophorus vespilloides]